jgi:hypothetical protein
MKFLWLRQRNAECSSSRKNVGGGWRGNGAKRNDLDFMIIEIKGILILTGIGSRDRLTNGERLRPSWADLVT